jgi:N6-L-threonylcarbamoyladenine synthase
MLILGIETSCDETSVSVLEFSSKTKYKILSNVVASQVALHAPYGGVVPHLAAREHEKNLPLVLAQSLKKSGKIMEEIDAIAITNGPGLSPALWRGVRFAQELSQKYEKPLIPVNHVEAHIYSSVLNKKIKTAALPALALIVSGGHTQLILIEENRKYKIIGETRDDAAGEAFDKIAKILDLGYPGGPIVSKLAEQGDKNAIAFPRPMLHLKNFDFSFSGLKTSVLYAFRDIEARQEKMTEQLMKDFCASAQEAIVDVLVQKTMKAARLYGVQTLIVGGGVSANKELQKRIKSTSKKEVPGMKVLFPNKEFYTDNAAPIGYTGAIKNKPVSSAKIEAEPNLRVSGKFLF